MRRAILPILCAGLLLCGTAAGAELPGLNKTETKNVELVVKNLDDLVKTAGDFIDKEKGSAVWVPTQGGRRKKVPALCRLRLSRCTGRSLPREGRIHGHAPGRAERRCVSRSRTNGSDGIK